MAVEHANYLLPCGRDVDQVWQRLDEPAEAHELTCAHCQGARESLTVLRELTHELAEEKTEPSLDLTGRIMAAVRADVRRHDLVDLPTPLPGGVRVSAHAVAAVLRFAADTVAGVRARRCTVTGVGADLDAGIVVELSLAVNYGQFALSALDEVRERVHAAAQARVGVRLVRLDLILDDVYEY